MKKVLFFILILFLISGCDGFGHLSHYRMYYNDKLSKKELAYSINPESKDTKKYCVYSLSYFLPINFWNVKFDDKGYIKKTIKSLNKKGIKGNSMKDIYINSEGIGTPLFSFYCIEVFGTIFEYDGDENNENKQNL